jgi:hypothetical protein
MFFFCRGLLYQENIKLPWHKIKIDYSIQRVLSVIADSYVLSQAIGKIDKHVDVSIAG